MKIRLVSVGLVFVAIIATFFYLASLVDKADPHKNTSTVVPTAEAYGIKDGEIVKLNLTSLKDDTEFIHAAKTDIVDAVRTDNYYAYITVENSFVKINSELAEEPKIIDTEAPIFYSLQALKGDSVVYALTRTEEVEEVEEHSEPKISTGAADIDTLYYSEINILDLTSETPTPTMLEKEGTPIKADSFAVSPDREKIVVAGVNGNFFIYSNEGKLLKEVKRAVYKIGFLDNNTIWFSDSLDGSEGSNQHVKLFNIDTEAVEDLYDRNTDFSEMSLLSFVNVGSNYVLLGNSYMNGLPRQTVFVSNSNFETLEGVVNLSSLSLNSNGTLFPVSEDQYLLDVRAVSDMSETATFMLSVSREEAVAFAGVSEIFIAP